jgi:ribonuclease PH
MATAMALKKLKKEKIIDELPINDYVAAISVGIVGDKKMLDLDYSEDSTADVDLNIVKTGSGGYVEIQGTAEKKPFNDKQLDGLLKLADKGIKELIALQKKIVG